MCALLYSMHDDTSDRFEQLKLTVRISMGPSVSRATYLQTPLLAVLKTASLRMCIPLPF